MAEAIKPGGELRWAVRPDQPQGPGGALGGDAGSMNFIGPADRRRALRAVTEGLPVSCLLPAETTRRSGMDRWALVTGAGGGIGEGIARVLAADGWVVAVNDIDADAAKRVAAEVGGTPVPGDVDTSAAGIVTAVADAAKTAGGCLGALINNAGMVLREPLATAKEENLDRVYRVNLRAPILLSRAALPHL